MPLFGEKTKLRKRYYYQKKEGKKEVGKLTKRERFLIGVSLYAGEGGKKSLEFVNSDPKIIKFMIGWFREFCNVTEEKFRGAIWIHDNLDQLKALKYWSDITKIPVNQFHKTYLVKNKNKSNKIRKNLHLYGVFSIRLTDANLHRKILGWMYGILPGKLI